jgi:hypothetical protein
MLKQNFRVRKNGAFLARDVAPRRAPVVPLIATRIDKTKGSGL